MKFIGFTRRFLTLISRIKTTDLRVQKQISRWIATIGLIVALLLTACGGGNGGGGGTRGDADLADLSISSGALDQIFQSSQLDYTAAVPFAVDNLQVMPTADDSGAGISVNGVAVASGRASGAVPLIVGDNTVTIVVTASNGSTQTYTIVITRAVKANPVVTKTLPINHAIGVAVLGDVIATLSDAIDPATVTTGSLTVKRLDGTPVTGDVSVSGQQVRFSPHAALRYATDYRATLTTAVADIDGAHLASDYQWQFNSGDKLIAGFTHTCVLRDSGTVKCWGGNYFGQLGLGDTNHRGNEAGEMGDALPSVDLGSGRTALALTGGDYHNCALLDNGAVKCWGRNDYGQLGLGDTNNRGDGAGEMGDALPVVDLGTGRTAIALTAGGGHTCALLENNQVKCWGYNVDGQLGLGDTNHRGDEPGEMGDALPAINLGGGRTAVSLTLGGLHTCALLDNSTVKCWGYNFTGQLGLGDTYFRGDGVDEMGDALPAVDFGSGRTAIALTAGNTFTCALLDIGAVKCWGSNNLGQLGLGDTDHRGDGPGEMGDVLPAVDLGSGRTAWALSAGSGHICALLDTGEMKCWGHNGYGDLGLGDTDYRGDGPGEMGDTLPAVDIGSGRVALALAAGGGHTCAQLDNGAVKCWGSNLYGQLGLGDTSHRGDGLGEMGDSLPAVDLGAP